MNEQLLDDFLRHPREFGPPRLHGNGFIQIDLDDNTRFHVWDPRLPRQKVSTQIHDHKFSFESQVLLGKLNHNVYTVYHVLDPHLPQHYVIHTAEPRNGADTALVSTGTGASVINDMRTELSEGSMYTFPMGKFHSSGADQLTATFMTKTSVYTHHKPQVLVPYGQTPDNDFNRYGFQEDELWAVVDEAVRAIKFTCGYR